MLDLLKRDDLVSVKHINELIQSLNKKEELEEAKKVNMWLIAGLVVLGIAVAGVIVYKMFFEYDEDFDDFEDFDDDFEDMDYEDDFDDFEDFDDEDEIVEDDEEFEVDDEE